MINNIEASKSEQTIDYNYNVHTCYGSPELKTVEKYIKAISKGNYTMLEVREDKIRNLFLIEQSYNTNKQLVIKSRRFSHEHELDLIDFIPYSFTNTTILSKCNNNIYSMEHCKSKIHSPNHVIPVPLAVNHIDLFQYTQCKGDYLFFNMKNSLHIYDLIKQSYTTLIGKLGDLKQLHLHNIFIRDTSFLAIVSKKGFMNRSSVYFIQQEYEQIGKSNYNIYEVNQLPTDVVKEKTGLAYFDMIQPDSFIPSRENDDTLFFGEYHIFFLQNEGKIGYEGKNNTNEYKTSKDFLIANHEKKLLKVNIPYLINSSIIQIQKNQNEFYNSSELIQISIQPKNTDKESLLTTNLTTKKCEEYKLEIDMKNTKNAKLQIEAHDFRGYVNNEHAIAIYGYRDAIIWDLVHKDITVCEVEKYLIDRRRIPNKHTTRGDEYYLFMKSLDTNKVEFSIHHGNKFDFQDVDSDPERIDIICELENCIHTTQLYSTNFLLPNYSIPTLGALIMNNNELTGILHKNPQISVLSIYDLKSSKSIPLIQHKYGKYCYILDHQIYQKDNLVEHYIQYTLPSKYKNTIFYQYGESTYPTPLTLSTENSITVETQFPDSPYFTNFVPLATNHHYALSYSNGEIPNLLLINQENMTSLHVNKYTCLEPLIETLLTTHEIKFFEVLDKQQFILGTGPIPCSNSPNQINQAIDIFNIDLTKESPEHITRLDYTSIPLKHPSFIYNRYHKQLIIQTRDDINGIHADNIYGHFDFKLY